jgi:hypothetical protein
MLKAYPLETLPVPEPTLRLVLRYLVSHDDPNRDHWFSGPLELYYGYSPVQLLHADDEAYRSMMEPTLVQVWCDQSMGTYHFKFDPNEHPSAVEAFERFAAFIKQTLPA